MSTITAAAPIVESAAKKLAPVIDDSVKALTTNLDAGGITVEKAVQTASSGDSVVIAGVEKTAANQTSEATTLAEPKLKSLFGLLSRSPKAVHLEAWAGVPAEKLIAERTAETMITLKEASGGSIKLTKGESGDIAAEFTYPASHKLGGDGIKNKYKQTIIIKESDLPPGVQTKLHEEGFLTQGPTNNVVDPAQSLLAKESEQAVAQQADNSTETATETATTDNIVDGAVDTATADTAKGVEATKTNPENTAGLNAGAH